MYTVMYDPKVDRWNILAILKKRELKLSLADELPRIGYVVYEEDMFIAAGFLRQCEGGYGMFDSYVTNPAMPPGVRNEALEMITKRLIKAATKAEVKHVISFSLDLNTIQRAERHGFAQTEHRVLVKVI